MAQGFDVSRFLDRYREETHERISRICNNILAFEGEPFNREYMANIVRELHTMKGSALMMGFKSIAAISHGLEDLFEELKSKEKSPNGRIIDLVLDLMSKISDILKAGKEDQASIDSLLAKMDRKSLLEEKGEPVDDPRSGKARIEHPNAYLPEARINNIKKSGSNEIEEKRYAGQHGQTSFRLPFRRLEELFNLSDDLFLLGIEADSYLKEILYLQSLLKEHMKIWESIEGNLEYLERIHAGKINQITGEVSRFNLGLLEIKRQVSSLIAEYPYHSDGLERIAGNIERKLLSMSMMSISSLLGVYPDIIRGMAQSQGKAVRVDIEGEEIELDRSVISILEKFLIHLLRNAVDHGIEKPEERKRLGKDPEGKIGIHIRSEGEQVAIEVSDDGKGIDLDRVVKAAIMCGLIDESDAESLSDNEKLNLIFATGLTTSPKVTENSGRGYGLDIVAKEVRAMSGDILISSEPGKGTKITLKIPVILSRSRVIVIRAAEQLFGIPINLIKEIRRLDKDGIYLVDNARSIRFNDQNIRLIDLGEMLGIGNRRQREQEEEESFVVVLSFAGKFSAIEVDGIVDVRDTVLKRLDPPLGSIKAILGAITLADGEKALALNIPELLDSGLVGFGEPFRDDAVPVDYEEEVPPNYGKQVLVVDDSMTSRELLRSIIQSHDYNVMTAVDGIDALEKVSLYEFDIIITDIEMPRLNGFELTRQLKNNEKYRSIPVVIITTLERDEERRRGLEVGADSYITKKSFDQGELIKVIERLIGLRC